MIEKRPGRAAESRKTKGDDLCETPRISHMDVVDRFGMSSMAVSTTTSLIRCDLCGNSWRGGHALPKTACVFSFHGDVLLSFSSAHSCARRQKLRSTSNPPPLVQTDSG